MIYIRSFNRFILISLALLGMSVSSANAALMQIEATGRAGLSFLATDFNIIYDDTSGDSLFQISELTSFSGTSFTRTTSPFDILFSATRVVGTPNITGVSTASGVQLGTPGFNWAFDNGAGTTEDGAATNFWTYTNSFAPSAVPVPAAVWLFGTALIGLIGFGKRRKAA